jgi:PIN domain nuclease of toxin-antitoxin system
MEVLILFLPITTDNYISILPITFSDTTILFSLPFHHRDPFDRMIISQAISFKMDIISKDSIFDLYLTTESIERVW